MREAADGTPYSGDSEVAGDATDDESRTDSTPDDELEAPRTTYAWGEYTCGRCGDACERVWRDDGAYVCADCKAW
ncbi:hypothetical protein EA472_07155 [Natrarchaeobius oligotrophus]|uniref:DUF7573 domain-containing protein n=2 Tax=Natrarchaeobius TaxID=2501796 RepID=A0A3N6MC73_NATCH|nr:hypothetical protein EA472_07155 [Natrarchaeobius chitinivorans]